MKRLKPIKRRGWKITSKIDLDFMMIERINILESEHNKMLERVNLLTDREGLESE